MSIAVEELHLAHEGIVLAKHLGETIARLVNSGPAGFEQAVRAIQDLAATDDGMRALKHSYQHNQTNISFVRARAKSGGYSLRTSDGGTNLIFGDGTTGKRLPTNDARKIAATYRSGSGKDSASKRGR